MHRPIQNAEKLPATRPDKMFSDAPPCFEQVVTSRTCWDLVLVKILVNSGITAPATVPQEMMADSTHHNSGLMPVCFGSRKELAMKVKTMDTAEVLQTRCVSGASKSKSFCPPNFALVRPSFKKYETSEVTIIKARMVNSQMMSVAQIVGLVASASARNAMSATPVTP